MSTPRLAALAALAAAAVPLAAPARSPAGTYPMRQCDAEHPRLAQGWSAYGYATNATEQLTDSCGTGGGIEDYVFTNGEPGAVTENGSSGSQVGLALQAPASAAGVTIAAVSATVRVSPVTGDDAFLGFSGGSQQLPGGAEILDGGAGYDAEGSWTLPQGARDFEAYVNCSTDHSSPTCRFSQSTAVPALADVTVTLSDAAPPALSKIAGTLPEAAARNGTVAGAQTVSFTAADTGSGVLSATLTLTPQAPEADGYQKTVSFGEECSYESWNACPAQQAVPPLTVQTGTLQDGVYTVSLSTTDAAANTTASTLGTITVHNQAPEENPATATTTTAKTAPPPPPPVACAIRLATPRAVTRAWPHAQLTVTGTASPAAGQPGQPGLPVTLEQVQGASATTLAASATTAAGRFALTAPPGPQRQLRVTCGAARATVQEQVRPRLSIHAQSQPGARLRFAGTIAGPPSPVPPVVLVQARGPHGWQTLGQPVRARHGRWRLTYRTSARDNGYTFPFRATTIQTAWAAPARTRAVRLTIHA